LNFSDIRQNRNDRLDNDTPPQGVKRERKGGVRYKTMPNNMVYFAVVVKRASKR
jgi:hypothetical protein